MTLLSFVIACVCVRMLFAHVTGGWQDLTQLFELEWKISLFTDSVVTDTHKSRNVKEHSSIPRRTCVYTSDTRERTTLVGHHSWTLYQDVATLPPSSDMREAYTHIITRHCPVFASRTERESH